MTVWWVYSGKLLNVCSRAWEESSAFSKLGDKKRQNARDLFGPFKKGSANLILMDYAKVPPLVFWGVSSISVSLYNFDEPFSHTRVTPYQRKKCRREPSIMEKPVFINIYLSTYRCYETRSCLLAAMANVLLSWGFLSEISIWVFFF